jgi:predicted RNA binding protein YcfA (HicA-like mRNA interferase family)
MKVDELLRTLKKNGWYEDRQVGSHKIFKHAKINTTISLPYHRGKEVPTGTLNTILKQAGLK